MKKTILLKDLLFESPDNLEIDGKRYTWHSPRTRPFYFTAHGIVIGKEGSMHGEISQEANNLHRLFGTRKYQVDKVLPGRVFFVPKVISFWIPEELTRTLLRQFALEFEEKTGIRIWNVGYIIDRDPFDEIEPNSGNLKDRWIPIEKFKK